MPDLISPCFVPPLDESKKLCPPPRLFLSAYIPIIYLINKMPVPTSSSARSDEAPPLFPALTIEQVDAALTSRWYDKFEDLTIKSTIINLDSIGEKDVFLKVRPQSAETLKLSYHLALAF